MGILIETGEGPVMQIEEGEGGALFVECADSLSSGRHVPTVILRPERIKDVARFLVAHLATLEAGRRVDAECRFPGERSTCTFPACECGSREQWRALCR